jgi:hypothetical protein
LYQSEAPDSVTNRKNEGIGIPQCWFSLTSDPRAELRSIILFQKFTLGPSQNVAHISLRWATPTGTTMHPDVCSKIFITILVAVCKDFKMAVSQHGKRRWNFQLRWRHQHLTHQISIPQIAWSDCASRVCHGTQSNRTRSSSCNVMITPVNPQLPEVSIAA